MTAVLPGTGGGFKHSPEDFEVEELPAYLPSGAGEHLYLWVEKRGRNTRDVVRALARLLEANERDVGVAGQKDRQAVTRQWISIHTKGSPDLASLAGDGFRVLSASRHGNKLRTGHLTGNRFTVRIRGAAPDGLARAQAIGAALAAHGLPNAYGPQRFGRAGENLRLGRALVREGARARDRFQKRMAVSALQAHLFNRVLTERLADGLFERALRGDVMKKLPSGGVFTCTEPEVDTARVRSFELSPTGPMFGHRMMEAKEDALARELRVLEAEGLTLAAFRPLGADAEGTRRPLRIPVQLEVAAQTDALELCFALPAGSYATVVLAEVMKSGEVALAEGDD